jgi:hypothetical protein
VKRLILMLIIGWLGVGCAALQTASQAKPGCEPGSGLVVAEACEREVENDTATLTECDARIDAWESRCLR